MLSKQNNLLPIKIKRGVEGVWKGCGREFGCESATRGGGWNEFLSALPHVPFALLALLESPYPFSSFQTPAKQAISR